MSDTCRTFCQPSCCRSVALRSLLFHWRQAISPFGQIERSPEIAQLLEGEGDLMHPVGAWVVLFDRDAFREGRDDDIFLKRGFALIDYGDDRRVKIVFDGKHKPMLHPPVGKSKRQISDIVGP